MVVVGRVAGEGARKLHWTNAILGSLDGETPLQLLCLEAAMLQQQQQLQQWGISRLRRHTHAPDALLYPGMVVAAKGRFQQARRNIPVLLLLLALTLVLSWGVPLPGAAVGMPAQLWLLLESVL